MECYLVTERNRVQIHAAALINPENTACCNMGEP